MWRSLCGEYPIPLSPARGQPFAGTLGNKKGFLVHQIGQGSPLFFVVVQSLQAGGIQIDQPFLAALADDTDRFVTKISQINGNELCQAHAAV